MSTIRVARGEVTAGAATPTSTPSNGGMAGSIAAGPRATTSIRV